MKVIIVGAGPVGLFAAYKLSAEHDVTVLEKQSYVGGSGLNSDGKLNFHPRVGGDLTEFMPEEEAWALVGGIRDLFKDLGVEMACTDEEGLNKLEAEASRAGIKFVKITQNHIGLEYLPGVMREMRRRLEERGVDIRLNTQAEDILMEAGRATDVVGDQETFEADAVLLAPGRIGSGWLIDRMRNLGVSVNYLPTSREACP